MKPELQSFIKEIKTLIDRSDRPARGEALKRAMAIPLEWPEWERPAGRGLAEQMAASLAPWGGKLHAVKSPADAVARAVELAREAEARKVARWRSERLDPLGWDEAFAPLGVEWIDAAGRDFGGPDGEKARRQAIMDLGKMDVGIIDCDLAVAHTGSLAVAHTRERDGMTNLLPWTLIALVWRSQVVPTIQDAFNAFDARFKGQPWPKHTVFITGPSRSGDIDLRVGQGAAGPGRHHIILIED